MGTRRPIGTLVLASLCTVVLAGSGPALGRIIHVADGAKGTLDGSSWTTAFAFLQDALSVAQAGDEIRVAQGLYHPAYPVPGAATPQDIHATFRLVDGVAIVGGYAGPRGPNPDLRDPDLFLTTLSGDLGGDDNDPNKKSRLFNNTRYIITAKDVGTGTVLDGLTVAHGYADDDEGAPLYNEDGSLVVRNCTFRDNGANDGDAGVYNRKGNVRIEHCRFLHNWTDEFSAALGNDQGSVQVIASEFIENYCGDGTAVVHNNQGQAVFFGCLFRANRSEEGRAVVCGGGETSLLYCAFIDNYADENVGAITCAGGRTRFAHCLFSGNSGDEVGALRAWDSSVSLEQCTFYGNVSREGGHAGALYGPDLFSPNAGTVTARGCIFWGNRALHNNQTVRVTGYDAQLDGDPNRIMLDYCCIEGWTPQRGGTGNLDADPLFVAVDQNDFHLKSQAGHWDAAARAWTADDVTSPCIDAGDPNSPVGPEPFPNGGIVNMGVYGGTCEAGKSWFGTEPGSGVEAADLNGDGRVDTEDYRLALQRWLQTDP
jgi:hypothetical protein